MDWDIVIYHKACRDGFAAAWCVWHAHGRGLVPRLPKFLALHPQSSPPSAASGKRVLVLDMAFPRDKMDRLLSDAARVMVIDHHEGNRAVVESLPADCRIFDTSRAACILTWQYLFGMTLEEPPQFLQYVEDRDLYRHSLPGSREFSEYFRVLPMDFARYDKIHEEGATAIDVVINCGRIVLEVHDHYLELQNKKFISRPWRGHRVALINNTYLSSDVANRILDRNPRVDIVVCWFWDHGQRLCVCSVRSREGVDSLALSATHGGSGHERASGFVCQDIDTVFNEPCSSSCYATADDALAASLTTTVRPAPQSP